MKTILSIFLFLLGGPLWLSAGVIADGTGYFPVVVMVADEAGVSMQGVSVQLRDAGQRDLESIADAEEKSRMARVGQPCDTNAHGAAVVFYYGGFTSVLSGAKKNYSRVVRGSVVIDLPGYEHIERAVSGVAGGKSVSVSNAWAPVMSVTLKRKPPPADFLQTDNEAWRRILATEITADLHAANIREVIEYLAHKCPTNITLTLAGPSKVPPITFNFQRLPLRLVLYQLSQNTGLKIDWLLDKGVPTGIRIRNE